MDIRKMVRKALLTEGKHAFANKYGCVMIYLNVEPKDWSVVEDLIDDEDLYLGDGEDSGYGKETDPHVTILFGLHEDVSDKDVEELIDKITKPNIELQKASSFKNEKFDVLKFDVESDDLIKYNKMFKTLPHTDTFPDYHAHCTIAYLKKGTADKYVKLLNDKEAITVKPDKIVYSKVNGDKKDYKLK